MLSNDKVDSSWAEPRRGLMLLPPCVHGVVFTTRPTVNEPGSLPLWKNLPGPPCLLRKKGSLLIMGVPSCRKGPWYRILAHGSYPTIANSTFTLPIQLVVGFHIFNGASLT